MDAGYGEPMSPREPRPPDNPERDPEDLLAEATEAVEANERRDLLGAASGHEARIRALEEGRRRLLLLLDIARGLNRAARVEDLLGQILVSALEISGADRAYLLQEAEDGTLRIVASRGLDGAPGDPDDLAEISHTILERVLEQGKTLYVSDALDNPDFKSQRSVRELSLRTVVAVPLSGPGKVNGALYVVSQTVAGLLEEEGVEILEAFGAQAALALETAAHREELVETAETLQAVNRTLKHALGERVRFDQVIGKSPAMRDVFRILERVVNNTVTVLFQGETGTGKELVAQALHFNGPRREANFIPVNCGAIPDQLLESELFGYRKGAFTGAERDHVGLVEAADGGTLFLDEVGEISPALQVKLLRMLQEGEVRRVGDSNPRKVNVRFIAATNRDLVEEVRAGRFREDLYYRINVVTVTLPPLRERGEDVLILAQSFLKRVQENLNRPKLQFGREARRLLMSYSWPGNVREMMNAVERAGALAVTDRIEPEDLLPRLSSQPRPVLSARQGTLKETLQRSEEAAILDALKESSGNISEAARSLGVSRQHLHTRIRNLGLRDKM
jgi:Nif-specific regulatory protein